MYEVGRRLRDKRRKSASVRGRFELVLVLELFVPGFPGPV